MLIRYKTINRNKLHESMQDLLDLESKRFIHSLHVYGNTGGFIRGKVCYKLKIIDFLTSEKVSKV
jgi:ATP-dependent protease ClpP protease subunit